ncbi:hypothetical protein LTR62_002486 [Meristemomyces frigidus]|uniref:Uncharacterized protein n=1 Tax=Meristemomyces frigidus TaxID=1508187 RepID=A0AAN7TMB0_9PEZI|nr:hypothetical protein LTR62_002486 [Meristemomyces frigidus]
MSSQQTTGDMMPSKTMDHVASYPIVNDTIEAAKSHPIGQKSMEIANGAYQRFIEPVEPYMRKPASMAKPYLHKVDEFAVSGLQQLDQRAPLLQEDSQTVIDTGRDYITFPIRYPLSVWQEEYNKQAGSRGENHNIFFPMFLFVVVTCFSLHVYRDVYRFAIDFLNNVVKPKAQEARKKGPDYAREARDTAQQYAQVGQEKFDEYSKKGQQKADQYSSKAEQAGKDAKGQAQQTKEDAKAKAGSK